MLARVMQSTSACDEKVNHSQINKYMYMYYVSRGSMQSLWCDVISVNANQQFESGYEVWEVGGGLSVQGENMKCRKC
jgi:hypothetical protein